MKRKAKDRLKVVKDGIEYEFVAAEEGGYVVSVPAYPSCVSEGDTFEEALENIQDALQGCLAAARDLDLPIPQEFHALAQRDRAL